MTDCQYRVMVRMELRKLLKREDVLTPSVVYGTLTNLICRVRIEDGVDSDWKDISAGVMAAAREVLSFDADLLPVKRAMSKPFIPPSHSDV